MIDADKRKIDEIEPVDKDEKRNNMRRRVRARIFFPDINEQNERNNSDGQTGSGKVNAQTVTNTEEELSENDEINSGFVCFVVQHFLLLYYIFLTVERLLLHL